MTRRLVLALGLLAGGCSKGAPPPPPPAAQAPQPSLPAAVAPPAPEATAAAFVAAPAPAECVDSEAITLFATPRSPRPGQPLRVLAVASRPLDAALVVHDPSGAAVAVAPERHGGAPFWWYAELPAPAAGSHRAVLQRTAGEGGPIAACKEIAVEADPAPIQDRTWGAAWGVHATWGEATENLYSAWIEKLFDAPLGEQPAWPALHEVLRDRSRNLLHDHLGEGEDDGGLGALPIQPDCADLPYFLRAYFAFKLGLPFTFSVCTRGNGGVAPKCLRQKSNLNPVPQRTTRADTFTDFLRVTLADTVHSGTGRSPAEDDGGDYYPIRLSFEGLRPGTIYADPYGHILVVAKRIPQSEGQAGVLLAVDGQPDGTVARKRFWQGNFLFALDPSMGSPGFKRFRPVVMDRGRARTLGNADIAAAKGYGDYGLDQYGAGVTGFYDRMDDVLSPSPLDPSRALLERVQALDEQVRARVRSVDNGLKYWASGGHRIDMPKGASIFETSGAWEDFSTPSRDLRLLIAVDVVQGFPGLVGRRPDRFTLPPGKDAAALEKELDALLDAELHKRTFTYERSDGSAFTLSLADVVARAAALEMAYNPNDCAETRWGAPEGGDEGATCKRHAPQNQRLLMNRFRAWFHERKRPPRT